MDSFIVERFARLFSGRSDIAGFYDSETNDTRAERKQVTSKTYEDHLEGRKSLGVYTVKDGNVVSWSCIDIDTQDHDLARRIMAAYTELGVECWCERTKKKGYHVWVFFKKDVPAKEARKFAYDVLARANAPSKVEVFPKQTHLENGQVGNFVNLPYYGGLSDRRRMIDEDGTVIPLGEFIDRARGQVIPTRRAYTDDAGRSSPSNANSGRFRIIFGDRNGNDSDETPSCILHAMRSDAGEGTRNNTVARLVGYWHGFRDLDTDDVLEKIREWNEQLSDPLTEREIRQTVLSVISGGYSWGCNKIREVDVFNDGCSGPQCFLFDSNKFSGSYGNSKSNTSDIVRDEERGNIDEGKDRETRNKTVQTGSERTDHFNIVDGFHLDENLFEERKMADMLCANGWLAEYMDFARSVTDAPRIFHATSGLALLAASLGNRIGVWSVGTRKMYPNLYLVIMCPSGFYRKSTSTGIALDILLESDPGAKMPDIVTPEALSMLLAERSDRILFIDEVGGMLKHWNRRDYMGDMKRQLTSFFDNRPSDRFIKGAKGTGQREEITESAITILGTTTADWLQEEITLDDFKSGFAGRILWVWGEHKEPRLRSRPFDVQDSIRHLSERIRRYATLDSAIADFSSVDGTYYDWLEEFESRFDNGIAPEISGTVSRGGTFVQKVATVLAASDSYPVNDRLLIRDTHIERAIHFVEWCIQRQQQMVNGILVFNDYERYRNRVLDELKRNNGRIQYKDAVRIISKLKRDVDGILHTMVAQETIRIVRPKDYNKPGPKPKYIVFPEKARSDEEDVA